MGCYSVGCALATLVRGIYFVFLLLLVAQVMPPAIGLPIDTTDGGKDIPGVAVAAGSDEMPQADGPNPDKRSVNTFPLGSTYYMSTKNHYELFIDGGKVKGIRAAVHSRGALMTVQTLPCQYNKTDLSHDIMGTGTGNLPGSCNAVTISSQMGKDTLYICMRSKSGRVYTATGDKKNEECEFIEQPEGRYLQYYSHLQYKTLTSQNRKCKATMEAVKSRAPTAPQALRRHKKKKTRKRKPKGKKKDPCALWYLEIDNKGNIRKGRNTNYENPGALFHKIDPNNTITVSPPNHPALPGITLDQKSKPSRPEAGQPGKARSEAKDGGRNDRHKVGKKRKGRKRKGNKGQRGGSAPFEVDGARRPSQVGSRSRNSRMRTAGGLPFRRHSGNVRSPLAGMALTSTVHDAELKRTPS